MDRNLSPPATRVGEVSTPPAAPLPSWPWSLLPQQYAVLSAASAHVCSPPAAIAENVTEVLTATGADRDVWVPSPSCANALRPQQYARPSVPMAHACALPTENLTPVANRAVVATGAAVLRSVC